MKKVSAILVFLSFLVVAGAMAAENQVRHFSGRGEVTSVDPLYARITVRHAAIKDFSGDAETEFVVASADLLKKIVKGDVVDFEFKDTRGDVKIEKITRTGHAEPAEDGIPLGRAAQDVITGTGEVVKGITTPVPPVHEAATGSVEATTKATGAVLDDANPAVKRKF